ncbi:hypothetical protein ACT35X_000019 [Enterobacter hormaechei]
MEELQKLNDALNQLIQMQDTQIGILKENISILNETIELQAETISYLEQKIEQMKK